MIPAFDTVIVVDWSAAAVPSPGKPSANAIWIGTVTASGAEAGYFRTRAAAVWAWLRNQISDGPANANNRFARANRINATMTGGAGPFWGRPKGLNLAHLGEKKQVNYTALGIAERRRVETLVPKAQSVWKLYTTGSVGSQVLMGLPMVARLAQRADEGWILGAGHAPTLLEPLA